MEMRGAKVQLLTKNRNLKVTKNNNAPSKIIKKDLKTETDSRLVALTECTIIQKQI